MNDKELKEIAQNLAEEHLAAYEYLSVSEYAGDLQEDEGVTLTEEEQGKIHSYILNALVKV